MNEHSEIVLPPLSDESIARIEDAVFDDIGDQRVAVGEPVPVPHRRRRGWLTALGVAAAFAGGILIAPPLLTAVTGDPGVVGASEMRDEAVGPESFMSGADSQEAADAGGGEKAAVGGGEVVDSAAGTAPQQPASDREIITTAQVTLRVADVREAADALTALAAEHDGYVEATDIGIDPAVPLDEASQPPVERGDGWIRLRIPAADLSAVLGEIDGEGEVLRSSIGRQDVTSTAVDLRARVAAARASVERLTELMSKSGSVGDLIAAEAALSDRQAQLESYEQQLKMLDEQVALSTIEVSLTERTSATPADPAGFSDGLLAGWNGLIVSLNAVVIAFGFLLPWLGIAAVALLIVWLVIRRRRARTRGRATDADR